MTTPNNGGAAFPSSNAVEVGDCRTNGHPGMTLRDYFAAKAMAAMIGTAGVPALCGLDGMEAYTAAAAYRMADAMLAARNAEES